MAVQAYLGAFRRGQPKLCRDRPPAFTRQGLECLGVRVLMRPGDEFIERDIVVGIGCDRAVTERRRATGNAEMLILRLVGQSRCRSRVRNNAADESGDTPENRDFHLASGWANHGCPSTSR